MEPEQITTIVQSQKLRDIFFREIVENLKQVTDGYGVLSDEEKDRLNQKAEHSADELEAIVVARFQSIQDDILANGRPHWSAKRDAITINDKAVKLAVVGTEWTVPAELYTHHGGMLIVLTDRAMSLDELHKQGELPGLEHGAQEGDTLQLVGRDGEALTLSSEFRDIVESAEGEPAGPDLEESFDGWIRQFEKQCTHQGIPEDEIRTWLKSTVALQQVSKRYTAAEVAKCVALNGRLEPPDPGLTEDSA